MEMERKLGRRKKVIPKTESPTTKKDLVQENQEEKLEEEQKEVEEKIQRQILFLRDSGEYRYQKLTLEIEKINHLKEIGVELKNINENLINIGQVLDEQSGEEDEFEEEEKE